jgi:hypothetical protein
MKSTRPLAFLESGRIRLAYVLIVAVAPCLMFGCAAFREEIPQLTYIVKLAEPGSATACDELAALFADHTALRIHPYKPPVLPAGEYCDITLVDASGNDDEVSFSWYMQDIHLVVRHRGALGPRQPNDRTAQLAEELVKTTKARYADAEVKQIKVYSNPFFGP